MDPLAAKFTTLARKDLSPVGVCGGVRPARRSNGVRRCYAELPVLDRSELLACKPEPTDDREHEPTATDEPSPRSATELRIATEPESLGSSDQVREPATTPATREKAMDSESAEKSSAPSTVAEGELIMDLGLCNAKGERAPVLEFSPERATVPEFIPERAPVPPSSPKEGTCFHVQPREGSRS